MEPWAVLEFILALVVGIGCIALVLGELHVIERAEKEALWTELEEKVLNIR